MSDLLPGEGKGVLRVYDAEVVDPYVAALRAQIEALEAKVARRIEPVSADGTDGTDGTDVERVLGRALLVAQQAADDAMAESLIERDRMLESVRAERAALTAAAERESADVVAAARREAERILASARIEAQRLISAPRPADDNRAAAAVPASRPDLHEDDSTPSTPTVLPATRLPPPSGRPVIPWPGTPVHHPA